MEELKQDNAALRANFRTIREDLLLTTQATLGRMLIEVGTAAHDLRGWLPPENDVEEGELTNERDQVVGGWRPRLDKMLRKISQAHEKAVQELQEVAQKMDAMTMEKNPSSTVNILFPTEYPKRLRLMADFGDGGNAAKRARPDQRTTHIKSPSTPAHSEDSPINLATVPTNQNIRPSSAERIHMHADREKLLLASIKGEDAEVDMGSITMHSAHPLYGIGKKWRVPFMTVNIDAEEAIWLKTLKDGWTRGGWDNRKQWLKAVMEEYRQYKANPSPQGEQDIYALYCRVRAGRFEKRDRPQL